MEGITVQIISLKTKTKLSYVWSLDVSAANLKMRQRVQE